MYIEVDGNFIKSSRTANSNGNFESDGDNYNDTNLFNPGISWIKKVQLEIGGQKIDEHSGVWMETWL